MPVVSHAPELAKPCTKCGAAKPLSEFYAARRETDGKTDWCKPCMNAQGARFRAAHPENRRNKHKAAVERFDPAAAAVLQIGLRKCCDCGKEKPYSEFPKFRGVKVGVGSRCRVCNSEAAEKWRAENRRQDRKNNKLSRIGRKYGLTAAAILALHQSQGGKCAICRKDLDLGPDMSIDHNHTTGAVRGILCRTCNSGIGLLRDSQRLIRAALKYLADREGEQW